MTQYGNIINTLLFRIKIKKRIIIALKGEHSTFRPEYI